MTLLYLFDLIGTAAFAAFAAFAASGAWLCVRRHMDLFGVLVLGLVTAVGTEMAIDFNVSPVTLVLGWEWVVLEKVV